MASTSVPQGAVAVCGSVILARRLECLFAFPGLTFVCVLCSSSPAQSPNRGRDVCLVGERSASENGERTGGEGGVQVRSGEPRGVGRETDNDIESGSRMFDKRSR